MHYHTVLTVTLLWRCTRLPTSTQWCPTRETPWVGTAGTARTALQIPYWPQRREGTVKNDALQNTCPRTTVGRRHRWMVLVGLYFAFFFLKHQPGIRLFEKKSYGIKFLELPNLSLLPSLYIWWYVLSDPTTETPTDKAWGVTLYKQVTEDKQWPSEASGAAQSRNSSLGLRQLCNSCPCQLAQAKSSLGCMNCDDQHWEGAVNDISENSRPCCLFTFCALHFYSGDNVFFFKMSAN